MALALLTTMSMPPKWSAVCSIASLTAASSRTSTSSGSARPPAFAMSSAAVWMVPGSLGCGVAVLAAMAMLAPSRAARSAMASPMPREAPVMNRVLPASGMNGLREAAWRRPTMRLNACGSRNCSNAARASGERSLARKISASSMVRFMISAGEPWISRRDTATASAGSAAISRAAFMTSSSTWSGGTTMLTRPTDFASSASIGRPMTRSAKARRVPIRRGASRLDPASGTTPSLAKGAENRALVAATT